MAKGSERVRLMKENFMSLHEQGFSIPEIAEKFNLEFSTVYKHLQSIADDNGVTRESLLQVVRNPTERMYREEEKKVNLDTEQLNQGFKEARKAIDFLIDFIDQAIKEEIE